MHLIQFTENGTTLVGLVTQNSEVHCLTSAKSLTSIILDSIKSNTPLIKLVNNYLGDRRITLEELINNNKIILPLTHQDPSHIIISGTGLTHLNSALLREKMHHDKEDDLNAAQKIYLKGLRYGKTELSEQDARPEWFYKGNGHILKTTNDTLDVPSYSRNLGEEAELVAVYYIGPDAMPYRIGFTLGNEFSDHALEKENTYYLAQSKIFNCSVGAEIYIGDLPKNVLGNIKILDVNNNIIWENEFHTGSEKIVHSLENLERYLFQNKIFRTPGDIHYFFLGADKISFTDEVHLKQGDKVCITASLFNQPLLNAINIFTQPTILPKKI